MHPQEIFSGVIKNFFKANDGKEFNVNVELPDLNKLDIKLLNLIQENFPLVPEPFAELARQLNIIEEEVIRRLNSLKEQGTIKHLGAVFDSGKLGYYGTLCTVKVPPNMLDQATAVINSYPEVTHNYLRNHPYNVWFTLQAKTPEKLNALLEEIKQKTRLKEIISLPATHTFKIKVNFNLAEEEK
jgi:DNA-binding Lrp family transcriptional regulator